MGMQGLDDACPVCQRPAGDHTLRQWAECLHDSTTLPFETIPDDSVAAANAALRQRFGLDEDTVVADNVIVRAATVDFSTGIVDGKLPALVHEFQVSGTGGPPATVAKIVFMGPPDGMRGYGRLVRDSANAAANRAEGR